MRSKEVEIMINPDILMQVKKLKIDFLTRGLLITGFFGSFAKGLETPKSDVDLLFEETPEFKEKYKGFARVYQLTLLKEEMEKELGRKVDLVNKNTLGAIGKKYILKEVVYV